MSVRLPRLAFAAAQVACLIACAAATSASAADLDSEYGIDDVPPPVAETKVEFGSGWYIRGDIGVTRGVNVVAGDENYNTSSIPNVLTDGATGTCPASSGSTPNCRYNNAYQFNQSVFNGPNPGAQALLASQSQDVGYNATLGAGYQFTRWFRADATFDFLKPSKSSYQGATVPCVTGTSALTAASGTAISENILSANCSPTLAASLRSYVVLANGYLDLGTWWRATPYVGAGVGMSFGHASASATYTQNNGVPYQISYADALSGTSFYQNWNQSRSVQYYNFAFAAMAGVAFDVYPHTKLDIGYRYLHLGEVLGTNLTTQEVRAGLRYMIDN